MKKLSELFESKQLDLQDGTINFISADELKTYEKIAKNFISDDARIVIDYLIANNSTYVKDLGDGNTQNNALAVFFAKQLPKDEDKRAVYQAIGRLNKRDRILEVPVFQTPEQFTGIITKKITPDEILLDLTSERGRSEIVEKYKPLMTKLVAQYSKKSTLTDEELWSAAYDGLVCAMNDYGKKSKLEDGEETDKNKQLTFTQYASYRIAFKIIKDIRTYTRTVREPLSHLNRERKEKGSNSIQNTVSGDAQIKTGSSKSDGNEKTLFDLVGNSETATRTIDQQDLDKLWAEVYRMLEKHFTKKEMDVWYSFMGLNGYKKLKNKEIAQKYGVVPSNISYYCQKINKYIQNTPSLLSKMADIRDLLAECQNEWDDDDEEPAKLMNEENNIYDEE